jgi:hypothetical protein
MKPPNFLEVFLRNNNYFFDFIIFLICVFPLRQVYDYAAAKMVADVMVAAVDSDQVDVDGEVDSDRHDSYGDDKMATVCSGDGVAAVLVYSSNNIESNCMDNKPHHDLVQYLKARCMNSMSSTPIKQLKSFSYLLLFIVLRGSKNPTCRIENTILLPDSRSIHANASTIRREPSRY